MSDFPDDFEMFRARSFSGGFDIVSPRRISLATCPPRPRERTQSGCFLGEDLCPDVTQIIRRKSDSSSVTTRHNLFTEPFIREDYNFSLGTPTSERSQSVSPTNRVRRESQEITVLNAASDDTGRQEKIESCARGTRDTSLRRHKSRSRSPSCCETRRKSPNTTTRSYPEENDTWSSAFCRPRLQSMPSKLPRSPGKRRSRTPTLGDLARIQNTQHDVVEENMSRRLRSFSISKRGRLIKENDKETSWSNSTCSNESRKDDSSVGSVNSANDTCETASHVVSVIGRKGVGKKSIIMRFINSSDKLSALQSFEDQASDESRVPLLTMGNQCNVKVWLLLDPAS